MYSLIFGLAAAQSLLFHSVLGQGTCTEQTGVDFTFYGFPDGNSDTTSFECDGKIAAGGDGSYASPESFATGASNKAFTNCEIIYIPYLQKYFQYHDHCVRCDSDFAAGKTKIDLWIGTSQSGGQAQIDCELAFGAASGSIIKSPPKDLPVHSQQLWDGTCHTEAVFKNPKSDGLCSGGGGSGSPAGPVSNTPVVRPPVSVTPVSVTPVSVTPVSTTPTSSPAPTTSTPTTFQTFTSTAPGTTTTAAAPGGGNGVTPGGGKLGDPCESYSDCAGNWICMGAPKTCHDNMKD